MSTVRFLAYNFQRGAVTTSFSIRTDRLGELTAALDEWRGGAEWRGSASQMLEVGVHR